MTHLDTTLLILIVINVSVSASPHVMNTSNERYRQRIWTFYEKLPYVVTDDFDLHFHWQFPLKR